jgi:flavin-dependent dehydrogenase
MSSEAWDCVVIGAGPSGSATALGLARRGVRVLLVDKATFPRSKVCGCCVNPCALEALRLLGLDGLASRGVPLESLRVSSRGLSATIRRPLGVSLSREALDSGLIEGAIRAGAAFEGATRAALLPGSSPSVELCGPGGSRVLAAKAVVLATGLIEAPGGDHVGPVARKSKIGAGAWVAPPPRGYEPGRIEMACGVDGYVGIVVLEDGRLDLAAALRPESVREAGGIGPAAAEILSRSGLPEVPGIADLAWRGTPRLTRSAARVASARVFRVGDAAGYVEPFTGEGIAWALGGARALAPIVARAVGDPAYEAEAEWTRAHERVVRARQVVCRAVAAVLRRPRWTQIAVAVLDRTPALAGPVLRRLHRTSG